MKAIVVHSPGDVRCTEVEKPVPGPREVLAKVSYSGICGTDVEIYKGAKSLTQDSFVVYPTRIGHEWSGIVEAVGSEVTDLKPGDRVISDTDYTCGKCENCLSGNYKKCKHIVSLGTVGNHKAGSHAEYILNHHYHMHKIPDSLPLDQAILVEPATIAYNALLDCKFEAGKTILVVGTGAIGLLAVFLAKQKGLRVLLAGRKASKLAAGQQLGADVIIDLTKEDLKKRARELTDGLGVDIFYETTGAGKFLEIGATVVRNRGILATVAFYEDHLSDFNANIMVLEHISFLGCEGANWHTEEVMEIMANAAKEGVSFDCLLTHRVSLEGAVDAIRNSKENAETKIKVVIDMNA